MNVSNKLLVVIRIWIQELPTQERNHSQDVRLAALAEVQPLHHQVNYNLLHIVREYLQLHVIHLQQMHSYRSGSLAIHVIHSIMEHVFI